MNVKPKVVGAGRITHRCYQCDKPISGDPLFRHRKDGQLVAVHPDCKEN